MSIPNLPKKIMTSLVLALPLPFIFTMLQSKLTGVDGQQSGLAHYIAVCAVLVLYALLVDLISTRAKAPAPVRTTSRQDSGASDEGPEGVETGSVKWFNVNKGFGFITTSRGDDVFVHFRSIRGTGRRSLRQGQSVRFDLAEGDKGLQAENVSALD
jgi:CspA family cold shock protein